MKPRAGGWHYIVVWEGGMYDSYEGDYTYGGPGLWTKALAWERVWTLCTKVEKAYCVVPPLLDAVTATAGVHMGGYTGLADEHTTSPPPLHQWWTDTVQVILSDAPKVAILRNYDCATR